MQGTQQVGNCPPRYPTVPIQPLPQTNLGVLEHSGLPTGDYENVTDIPPDLNWMMEMQLYDHMFRYSVTDTPRKEIDTFYVHSHQTADYPAQVPYTPWNYLPFLGSKWWNGTVSFKFMAIKPPRVTGKIIIRYYFDQKTSDSYYRGIAKEWDLGQSSEFEFDVPAVNPVRARPTWIPRRVAADDHIPNDGTYSDYLYAFYLTTRLARPMWYMGVLHIEAAQRLQPGGIFPDSIRILVFRCWKNSKVYMPTDFRGIGPHMLTWSTDDHTYETPVPEVLDSWS